jgi:hypothetical protein
VFKLLFFSVPAALGHRTGWHLLNLQTDVEMLQPQKAKHTLLPLLTVLFLISYGLMVMLIVEQGKTIDTQRYLIRSLFSDSSQLTALRNGVIQKHNNEAQAKARTQAAPSAVPQGRAKSKASNVRPLPQKPPKDTSDTADERRSLITI